MVAVAMMGPSSFLLKPALADDVPVTLAVVTGLEAAGRRVVGGILIRGSVGDPGVFFSACPVIACRKITKVDEGGDDGFVKGFVDESFAFLLELFPKEKAEVVVNSRYSPYFSSYLI